MCVLSGEEIYKLRDEIFSGGSWDCKSFQEATYDLRVDTKPVLRVEGKLYEGNVKYESNFITIRPGEMALLPTMETFSMPKDLVGDIKIKFSHTRKGLTPLFGPKVDPCFGRPYSDERLYLMVSNLGVEPIRLKRGDPVFTVQFHKLHGDLPKLPQKERIGPIVAEEAHRMGDETSLGFVSIIEKNVEAKLGARLDQAEYGTVRVVMFGILLVASAMLAGAFTVLFTMVTGSKEGAARFLTMSNWEGVLLLNALYGVCIVLSLSVLILSCATIVQACKRPTKTR